jgi:hypothetical protein
MIAPDLLAPVAVVIAILALVAAVASYRRVSSQHEASERRPEEFRQSLLRSLPANQLEQLEWRVRKLEQEAHERREREIEAYHVRSTRSHSASSEAAPPSPPLGANDSASEMPSTDAEASIDMHESRAPEQPGDGVDETPTFSSAFVSKIYAGWCQDHVRPASTGHLEVGALTYESTEGGGVLGVSKRHVLREVAQMAEFVRFSVPGSGEGLILPDPEAHFTPNVAHVFPGLTRDDYDNPVALTSRTPVVVRRRGEMQWEVQ